MNGDNAVGVDGRLLLLDQTVGTRPASSLAAATGTETSLEVARPIARPFTNRSGAAERPFDVTRDGKRFLGLIATRAGSGAASRTEIHVVLNWFDELRARAPVKR